MGFFISGQSTCAICNGVLTDQDDVFSTWGVFTADPDLFCYCEAPMHWSCYLAWPRREAFARAYFEFWVEEERTNRFWARAYLDDRVLVTVNPSNGKRGEALLVLARTGSRVRVDMTEWERWLDAPLTSENHALHPAEVHELREIAPALRAALPTADAVMNALDGESKGWVRTTIEDD